MKPRLDMDKIAKGLRAERKGKVYAEGGYFGAAALAAEVQARFRVPEGGGRATDPAWTERRQVPLTGDTPRRLERLVEAMRRLAHVNVEPLSSPRCCWSGRPSRSAWPTWRRSWRSMRPTGQGRTGGSGTRLAARAVVVAAGLTPPSSPRRCTGTAPA